jgi:hypothetical protein
VNSLQRDVDEYEVWLGAHFRIVKADLKEKHRRMRKNVSAFLRATYFRWARTIESVCPELAAAPIVACIGDINVENFGTWRDGDGRLVWGINDYDEAAFMPYAFDLVRLATSACLSPAANADVAKVVAAVLAGYRTGLADPRAVLLDQHAGWLRTFANPTERTSTDFWRELDACADADPPRVVQRALARSLPDDATIVRFASQTKGGGSLGRPRFLAIAEWNGGRVVREAKAYVPSAWLWAHRKRAPRAPWFVDLARGSFRSPDPFARAQAGFIIRRVAPDARKIELADVAGRAPADRFLAAMAADLAAVHAADPRSPRILEDLGARTGPWLLRAVNAALQHTRQDYAAYAGAGA